MSSKKKSTTTSTANTTNSLPDWLTSPYQAATSQATALSQQPAISSATQGVLDRTFADSAAGSNAAQGSLGILSGLASGDFGNNALTQAAGGDFLASNPFTANGMLNTGYIDDSFLNDTAAGKYLTADSNPYIAGVAQKGADAAQAAINSQFGAAGRSNGSGLYAQLFSQGISDAANSVYAQNYANERQMQQAAQNALLGAQQSARENALTRQYSAYDSERNRQQSAAGNLLSAQLSANSQIPSSIAAMLTADNAGLAAGQYQDNADMEKLRQYTSILSALAAPYGISDQNQSSTTTTKSSGLGSTLGQLASLGSAIAAPFTGRASLLGGMGGAVSPILANTGFKFNNGLST